MATDERKQSQKRNSKIPRAEAKPPERDGLATYVISAALAVIFIVVIALGFISRRKAEADLKQIDRGRRDTLRQRGLSKDGAPNNEIVSAGKHPGFYRRADLCADERLCEKLAR